MTPTAEMRMPPSFPAPGNEKRLAEGRREADVAGVGAEIREHVGLVERDVCEAVVQRVEALHVAILQGPLHRIEVALLRGEELPKLRDVVPIARRHREREEAVVELGID